MTITPEEMAAYADGELDPARAALVEAAIAGAPDLAKRVQQHRALRQRLAAHYAPIVDEPVPNRLSMPLRDDANVVAIGGARGGKGGARRWGWIAGPALAASIALALFIGGQPADEGMANGQLVAALDGQLSGGAGETRILLSFQEADGTFCRAFAQGARGGIACHDNGEWSVRRDMAIGTATSGPYRQAGSAEAEIMAAAQAMAAGPALSAQQEQAARESGWR